MDSIGHLEWSSLSSLGEYGGHEFKENPAGTKFLGWPLHELGDVIVPRHLFATMAYGHNAIESAMSDESYEHFWGEESAEHDEADNVDYQENSSSEEETRCDDGYGFCVSWHCGSRFECIEGYTGPESVSVETDVETMSNFDSSTDFPCGETDWYTWEHFGCVSPSSTICTEGCCVPDGYQIPGDDCDVQSCTSSAGCDEGYSCSDGCCIACIASNSVDCESNNDCEMDYICCDGSCVVGPVCTE